MTAFPSSGTPCAICAVTGPEVEYIASSPIYRRGRNLLSADFLIPQPQPAHAVP
ncbi:MAG: hypothetical protein ABI373_00815 [Flavobacteriales bacterium]